MITPLTHQIYILYFCDKYRTFTTITSFSQCPRMLYLRRIFVPTQLSRYTIPGDEKKKKKIIIDDKSVATNFSSNPHWLSAPTNYRIISRASLYIPRSDLAIRIFSRLRRRRAAVHKSQLTPASWAARVVPVSRYIKPYSCTARAANDPSVARSPRKFAKKPRGLYVHRAR